MMPSPHTTGKHTPDRQTPALSPAVQAACSTNVAHASFCAGVAHTITVCTATHSVPLAQTLSSLHVTPASRKQPASMVSNHSKPTQDVDTTPVVFLIRK
jgi:hypothetical protein